MSSVSPNGIRERYPHRPTVVRAHIGAVAEARISYASMWVVKAAYEVEVDGLTIPALTESSPSVYFPRTFSVGRVALKEGQHLLKVRIKSIVNNHAMNLENVILVPAGR